MGSRAVRPIGQSRGRGRKSSNETSMARNDGCIRRNTKSGHMLDIGKVQNRGEEDRFSDVVWFRV